MDFFFLELQLTVTAGVFYAVGGLRLFCWLKAIKMGAEAPLQAKLVAVRSSVSGSAFTSSERELSATEVGELIAHLRRLRFPECKPAVEGVFDTSDGWENAVLRATLNDDTGVVELAMCASGFDGEDAAALRAVFRRLLATAGVLGEDDWRNLTGPGDESAS